MNPTPAETLKLYPRMRSATIPPIRAKGMLDIAMATCRTSRNSANRTRKMMPIVSGMTIARRRAARERFSNWPPHVMEYPLGSAIAPLTFAWASATKLPWSRPRIFVRTEICRFPSSRWIIVAPSTSLMVASCESGILPRSGENTRSDLTASIEDRYSGEYLTTMSNLRSPSYSLLTGRPPIAASIIFCMSMTLTPNLAAASRSMSTVSCA